MHVPLPCEFVKLPGRQVHTHAGMCVALPPKRKLRPLPMQQAAPYVICAQYSWQVRPLSGCEGACGLRWCGL